MPLSDADIVQSNSGGFNATSGAVTLGAATTAGNTLILAVSIGAAQNLSVPSGYTQTSPVTSGNARLLIFRKSDIAAGETLPTLSPGVVVPVAWVVMEWAGMDLGIPVDVIAASMTATTSGTTINNGTTPTSTAYDGVVLAFHALNVSGTTPGTISAQTGSVVEHDQQGQAGTSNSITLAVSTRSVQQLGAFTSTATASATMTSTNPGAAWIAVYAAAGSKRAVDPANVWGGEWLTNDGLAVGGGSGGLGAIFFAVTGAPTVGNNAANARTGDGYLELPATATIQSCQGATHTITTTDARQAAVLRVCFRFVGSLPAADTEICSLNLGAFCPITFRVATGKLGFKVVTGSEVASDAAVVADQWIAVEMLIFDAGATWTGKWEVTYDATPGASSVPVAQTDASFTTASGLSSYAPVVGRTAAPGSAPPLIRYDDVVVSITRGHYPLGEHRIYPLMVDPAGTLTISGTAGNFALMTSNATGGAFNAATAKTNISDIPPTIGGSASGFCQTTVAASDYVEIPMDTTQAVPAAAVRGVKMYACGWGAGAASVAATLLFRGWDGSAEVVVANGTTPQGFGNQTSAPGWLTGMMKPAGGWTQAKLDNLAFRVGFSADATPDIGIHAIMAEVAVQPVTTQGLFGDHTTAAIDPVSGGVQAVTATPTAGYDATLHYEIGGTPTDVPAPGGAATVEVIEAPDAPTVEYLALYPPPEDISDA